MATLGQFLLQWTAFVGVVGIGCGLLGLWWRDPRFLKVCRRVAVLTLGLLTFAEVLMLKAIVTNDFTVQYVANYSSRSLPLMYKVAALWAGQSASLMFWGWLLAVATVLYVVIHGRGHEASVRETTTVTVLMLVMLQFFLGILLFVTPPFARMTGMALGDGQGLNPLLQNPWMAVHPPVLFIGYVGLAIPFVLVLAGLLHGRFNAPLVIRCRAWTIVAWCFLSVGIIIGGFWAYLELGWGGYWAWDPVENASLIPWLTATALLHLLIVQQRSGIFKGGTVLMAGASFVLTIFGTYLTRSGVLSSLHTFAPNQRLGAIFMGLMAVSVLGMVVVMVMRRGLLKPEQEMVSMASKEMAFLLTAILLVGLALVVFGGTTLPLWARLASQPEVTVGTSFYNRVTGPLFLVLLMLMGAAPVLKWRETPAMVLVVQLGIPATVGLILALVLNLMGFGDWRAMAGYGIALFTMLTLVLQLIQDTKVRLGALGERLPVAVVRTVWQRRRRYGGLLSHMAMVLLYIGVIASTFHKAEQTATLGPSESLIINNFELRYEDLAFYRVRNADVVGATLTVYRNGRRVGELVPEKRLYDRSQNVMTEASRRTTPWEDLYVVLAAVSVDNQITVQAFVNPLVGWIWWSSLLLIVGVLMAVIPQRRGATFSVPEPVT